MADFFMDGVQLSQGQSHFEEAVYFLPLNSQNFLLLRRCSQPWSHQVIWNLGHLDWESSTLKTSCMLKTIMYAYPLRV